MISVKMTAASRIEAGQAVRTTGSPPKVAPAARELHTKPFFGVACEGRSTGQTVEVQIGGVYEQKSLGTDHACAVGVNATGYVVRASDTSCESAPNWIGTCDDAGTVTIDPRRDPHLNVLDFGATGLFNTKEGDEKEDDTSAIQQALDRAARTPTNGDRASDGKVVYIPPGNYRITKPLVVSNGCILEGAGTGNNGTTTILADVVNGDFNLTHATGIGTVDGETVYCAIALTGPETGQAMNPKRGRADGAVLRSFALESIPQDGFESYANPHPILHQEKQMDGICVTATVCLEKLRVGGFRRNGITIRTGLQPIAGDVADCVQLRDCIVERNGNDGVFLSGTHSNIILAMNVQSLANGSDGIEDDSFFGSVFVGCHAEANLHRNYNFDRYQAPAHSAYLGCYAEKDAPCLFKGNAVVLGGHVEYLHPDSHFFGFLPSAASPPELVQLNKSDPVRQYPGATLYGNRIDVDGFLYTPGNGYTYKAISRGRTYATSRSEGPPEWRTGIGDLVPDHDGLVWKCEGPYTKPPVAYHHLGGTQPGRLDSYGYSKPDGTTPPFFTKDIAADSSFGQAEGRLVTHLTSGVERYAYFETTYENGPVPGAFTLPDAWIGSYYDGERRIAIAYGGTPVDSLVGYSCQYYQPGDLLLNASTGTGTGTVRNGPIGWAVKAPCARPVQTWQSDMHYPIGAVVQPTRPNGRTYRMIAYTGGPSDPKERKSGKNPPATWNPTVGGTTPDNDLSWQTLYDVREPANQWAIEPLPSRAQAQADSTARDVDRLCKDFNELLAKMREANLLAP